MTTTIDWQSKFIRWLKNKKCPKCGETRLIPMNPRYDRKVRCCNCGALGRVK